MSGFFDRLAVRAWAIDSWLCVGIDPLVQDASELVPHALRIIAATHVHAAAFKPNSAYFERFGAAGLRALEQVIAAIPADIPVILDAKRGDIGQSNAAYGESAFKALGAHALTVHPYLGLDVLASMCKPQTPAGERPGLFVLCRTSNTDADNPQLLQLNTGKSLFEWVAEQVGAKHSRCDVGLVVGASDLDAAMRVRALLPDHWFLMPGIGRQGGDLAAALQRSKTRENSGVLVNVSGAIATAADPAQAAAEYANAIRAGLQTPRSSAAKLPGTAHAAAVAIATPRIANPQLARDLLSCGIVKFGQFTLKSGIESPVYLDFRRIVGYPHLLTNCALELGRLLQAIPCDCIAALPYAGMPLGTATSLHTGKPMVYPRKTAKAYGTMAEVEGVFAPGQRAVMLDDLASDGGSKLEAKAKLEQVGLEVLDVLVLVDRESGARAALANANLQLHAVYKFRELLEFWRGEDLISAGQADAVRAFLSTQAQSR